MARRRGTRASRLRRRRLKQSAWQQVRNRLPPIEVLSADEAEHIHAGSLRILRDIGMTIQNDEALDVLRRAGASVSRADCKVRFDPAHIEEVLPLLPAEFDVQARDPAKSLTVGGDRITFCSTTGPAFASDLDRGRRPGTHEDMCDFIRIVHSLNIIHHEGGAGLEPLDLPERTRYLDMMYAQCTLTDKTWHPCWKNSREKARDIVEMSRISLGVSRSEVERRPGVVTGITTNSPLLLDGPIAEGLMELARANQPIGVAAFTMAGAMSPATLAGALVQQNAEVLAGFMLIQAVCPGCPVLYGNFATNVDLRSGAPAFGTPEHAKCAHAAGQMARRYRVPFRSSNTTGSNTVDAQATYENAMSLWGTVMGHANLLRHAGGWLEGGLTASFEKLIVDAEQLQAIAEYLRPIDIDESTLAIDVIAEVAPGGHFLDTKDTLDRYENAFYEPMLSDWRTFEAWNEDGARSATERANAIWKQLLEGYQRPAMDPAIEEELTDYVARRKIAIVRDGK